MKKIFKFVIAFVLIAAVAIGAYFIFNRKKSNLAAYNKINNFYTSVKSGNENIVNRVDGAIDDMLLVINQKNFNIPEAKTFLTVYSETLEYYSLVKMQIEEYGIFVNKRDNTNHVKKLETAVEKLKSTYTKGYKYLSETFFTVSSPENQNADYIVNFCNLFEKALPQINSMYYNAAIIFAHGTKNTYDTNNFDKLKIEYYAGLVKEYVKSYDETQNINLKIQESLNTYANAINSDTLEQYLQYKETYDMLISKSKSLNISEIVNNVANNTWSTYVNQIKKESTKTLLNNYEQYVIRGAL